MSREPSCFRWLGQDEHSGEMCDVWEGDLPARGPGDTLRNTTWISRATGQVVRFETATQTPDGEWMPRSGITLTIYPTSLRLDDGSILIAWRSRDKQATGSQDAIFADLEPGGPLPALPVVIESLTPIGTGSGIRFVGRHLAHTVCKGEYVEWALYVPDGDPPKVRATRFDYRFRYHVDREFALSGPVRSFRAAGALIDATSFAVLIPVVMAELSDSGTAPDHVTYDNVIPIRERIRASIA